mgnify:CR=1 FL=1|tara:strand:+ start:300 stop:1031 length:732 start_codon:yes stop_codon:yes gene_type:complete
MSVGNLKTHGQKGTNWTWQYRVLLGLDNIAASIATTGKDWEADLISIVCGANPAVIRLEVRIYNISTGGWTIELYPPGSTTKDTTDYSACTKTYLEQGDATEATLLNILAKNTAIEVDTSAIATSTAGILLDTADIETATEATALSVADIKTNTDKLRTATNTAVMVRGTGSVTVTQVVKSISVYNAHASATGTINIGGAGAVNLLAGETVNFDAGGAGNAFPASHFVIDGGGSADMLIIYVY